MTSLSQYYGEKLYPLQNGVLRVIEQSGTDFFLTGGTALSRSIAFEPVMAFAGKILKDILNAIILESKGTLGGFSTRLDKAVTNR